MLRRTSALLFVTLAACGVEVITQQTHSPTPLKTQAREPDPVDVADGALSDTLPPEATEPPPPSPQTISVASSNVLPEASRKAVVLNAIRGASKSIYAGLYLVTDTSITQSLTDAKSRGVDVKVVIDDSSQTSTQNKKAVDTLTAAGITVKKATGFKFHHAKYMLIDGIDAWIMTCNFTDSSFSSNREVVTKVTDTSAVASLKQVFDTDVAGEKATFGDDNVLIVSPDNTRNKLNGLIGNATKEIFVSVQTVDDNTFVYRLIGMKQAGVRVRVLMANPADKEGDAGDAEWLKKKGVEVRYLPNPYLHEKVILADEKVYVGSVNLTETSITLNREIGFVGDAAFAATMKTQLELDWEAGVSF